MRVINFQKEGDREEYDRIWDAVFDRFDFHPSPYPGVTAFELDVPHRVFHLPKYVWDEAQEALVGRLLASAVREEIYALDYNHLAYAYVPGEPMQEFAPGEDFPTYYPNGDYYFFVAKDLSFGWLGHPWQNKLILFGDRMLHLLDGYESQLNIVEEQ